MINSIGIRRETRDRTQRRSPLSPGQVRALIEEHQLRVVVEPWDQRIFPDDAYRGVGAIISEDLASCNIIFGVKEIAPEFMWDDAVYCFFSHTIKGQSYNMPMLQRILDGGITLFDYELVKDENEKRLVFFGDYAGYAGMIDVLWAFGRRLAWEGMETPFADIRYATSYDRLSDAEDALRNVAARIETSGLPRELVPLVTAFTGYGHVSRSAQKLYDILPSRTIAASELPAFMKAGDFSDRHVYKVEFTKPDLYAHREGTVPFAIDELNSHPERFVGIFEHAVPHCTLIVNGIYWEPRFPRLLTKGSVRGLYDSVSTPRLRVIGDITCDIDGSIELTVKETDAENPVYVYDPASETVRDGWEGRGPVVLAVDKLPTELPLEASEEFGRALMPFVPHLAGADYRLPADTLSIPPEFRRALIAYRGELTPPFSYLRRYLP
jgi:saccharopine dehydrogenase (NAD+, L-lysine-forming)